MRLFYEEYKDDKTRQQAVAELSWGHNLVLMSKIKDKDVRMVYAKAAVENGWSRSTLEWQIAHEYHKRVGASANNFKRVLPPVESELANDSFKDPVFTKRHQ